MRLLDRLAVGTGALVLAAGFAAAAPAAAEEASEIGVELNKLEAVSGGCRAFFVIENDGPRALEALKVDLVAFDAKGVIAKRLAVEFGPVRAKKTVVKLFDMSGVECGGIGRILLNDVLTCGADGDEASACLASLSTSSRADVPFVK